MPPPLFAVLVSTYNHAAFVVEALDSVVAQTDRDFELIVVDDESTDGTDELVRTWMENFSQNHQHRVSFCGIPNGGQSAALEHGFSLCSARYVCLLDSDDRWRPGKLEAVRAAIRADSNAGMIVHPLEVIDHFGQPTGVLRPRLARLSQGDLHSHMVRSGRHVAPATSGVVIRSDLFARLLPMPTTRFRFGADAYLTFGASLLAPVRAIPEVLGEYRVHSDGQYIQRVLTPEGLRRSVELQGVIADHFGISEAMLRNTLYTRNSFALAKLAETLRPQWVAYRRLATATALDSSFTPMQRVLLLGFWTVCLVAPRKVFRRLWRAFQLRQAGLDHLDVSLGTNSGTGARA
jgi:glycosyltransferase involved in cell wall biosynthesis